jgi:surface antigen
MSNKFLVVLGTAAVSSLVIGTSAVQAAETFSVDNVALNTNLNFRLIDGNPRMSIYQRNDNDPDQQFDRLPGNRGGILLKHRSTGRCLNAHYLFNGAEINVWSCDPNDPDQNWNLEGVSDGRILIKRTGTNLCVDTPTRSNTGKVHLWTCDANNSNQRWRAVQAPSGGAPLLTQQGPQYFKDRPQFYTTGNIFAQSRYGSSLVNNTGSTEGNCTWYAHGRVKELGGNSAALNSMRGNANQWHLQLSNGARILARNESPQLGDIAQWSLNGQNHVAVVERVYTDQNGVRRIVVSESHYSTNFDGGGSGTLHRIFDYRADNPSRYIRVPKA